MYFFEKVVYNNTIIKGELMSKLQQHYINFQSQQTIQQKINYLQTNQKELSQYNINIPNLISHWKNLELKFGPIWISN